MKCLFMCLLFPVILIGQEEGIPVDSYKNPRTAVLCSALFPGAGQIYNGKWLKAGIFSGFEVYTLYKAHIFHEDYQQDPTNKNAQINRNKHLWYAAGVYVYAMLDAYVDAHLSSFPEGNLVFNPVDRSFQFALILEF
ncbi:MAG: hypothetical protein PWP06_1712 [Candidatus Marinimicrobia bacterium]|nr:hypothetical protein [Candidatus Neomarinimicrobiota bacterium]